MKHVDTAHRSFLTLVVVGLVPYSVLVFLSCGVVSTIGHRIVDGGPSALSAGPGDLRPAVLAFGLLAVGAALAARSTCRQVGATRRLVSRVRHERTAAPAPLVEAACAVGLSGRIDYLPAPEPFSFAYGLVHPRVVVSSGLLDVLQPDELRAVLEHERYHVHHLDPLKIMLSRFVSAALFFLPALRDLQSRYGAASELAADRRAMRACGRGPLAAALYRTVRGPVWGELSTAAAMGGTELLDIRVEQLETGREPPVAKVSLTAFAATSAALGLLGIAVALAVVAIGGLHELLLASTGSAGHENDPGFGLHDVWLIAPALGAIAWVHRRKRAHLAAPVISS